ncbi:hypothetical protein H4S14_000419 [Agrobacterium vitis]|nr:hypothetical protein [Agrobacterium vitis]MBE1436692.1 hypothetical protein [Agrobacterium vitis]
MSIAEKLHADSDNTCVSRYRTYHPIWHTKRRYRSLYFLHNFLVKPIPG